MKKITTLFNLIVLLLGAAVFTSCDPDVDKAMDLSGEWDGDFGMYYKYRYSRTGNTYTFHSYETDIVFYPNSDYATRGYGYQVDWYKQGPYDRISYRFNWEVSNGVITLTYPGYSEYNATIRDYYISNSRFSGYFGNNKSFTLYKIADYYNWSDYSSRDYYQWNYNDNWYNSSYDYDYYAKSRAEGVEFTPSEKAKESDGQIIGFGNRFNDNK